MHKKITALVACAAICAIVLLGCSSNSDKAQEIVNDAAENTETTEQVDPAADEMPAFDFGIDEDTYFVDAYSLESADSLDLISCKQLLWLAERDRKATIVIAEPESEQSSAIIAEAQKYAQANPVDIYVFEPHRAQDESYSESTLLEDLHNAGLVNLDNLKADEIIVLTSSKLSSDGLTGVDAAYAADDVTELLKSHYELACCG